METRRRNNKSKDSHDSTDLQTNKPNITKNLNILNKNIHKGKYK
jgi:hypothetical protein